MCSRQACELSCSCRSLPGARITGMLLAEVSCPAIALNHTEAYTNYKSSADAQACCELVLTF